MGVRRDRLLKCAWLFSIVLKSTMASAKPQHRGLDCTRLYTHVYGTGVRPRLSRAGQPDHFGDAQMPRAIRDTNLETRTARSRLKVAHRPYYRLLAPGLHVGYRKLSSGPGTWIARRYLGAGKYSVENIRSAGNLIVTADDFDEADGSAVLNFSQAQERVRMGARRGGDDGGKLLTVGEAVDRYRANLKLRGGDQANASRVRLHLPAVLAGKEVAALAARDFRGWREGLVKAKLSAATINRIDTALKAALNFAAAEDERITGRAWKIALANIPGAARARNIILPEDDVRRVITAAYAEGDDFGLLIEVAAVTGARPSQIRRIEVCDLQDDRGDPRILMPASSKGRGPKTVSHRPVPIPADLAFRLRLAARERATEAPLLLRANGRPWARLDHAKPFAAAAERAGFRGVTMYALRHSNIVRCLLAGVPIRLVAVNHDTSVLMIEKSYSAHISDHTDAISRRALLDMAAPVAAPNIIKLR
jgi:integrase